MKKRPITPVVIRITVFYVVVAIALSLLLTRAPWAIDYLPVGAVDRMFSTPSGPGLLDGGSDAPIESSKLAGKSVFGNLLYLSLCFSIALLVAIPVAEVYKHTARRKKGPEVCSLRVILLLPICVAGIVLIVQNSLALAFSLAGLIAGAGVRFRTNVRRLSDVLFFMVSIGIGLASGAGALGIAAVMSMVFCYASLLVYVLEPERAEKEEEGDEEKAKGDGD
jgi:hypothetical protein